MEKFFSSLRVGWILGTRQIRHGSFWASSLTIMVLVLTLLSNILISGILFGLVQGIKDENRDTYSGDILLSNLQEETHILNSQEVISKLSSIPGIESYSPRYKAGVKAEANYQERRNFNTRPNVVGVTVFGVNVADEDQVTKLSSSVIEGSYFEPGEHGVLLIGSALLNEYSSFGDQFRALENVNPGDRIRLSLSAGTANTLFYGLSVAGISGGETLPVNEEFVVKGIFDSKSLEVSSRIFITEYDFRRLTGRSNLQVNEIALNVSDDASVETVRQSLVGSGIGRYALIQAAEEALPSVVHDVAETFSIVSAIVGVIVLWGGTLTVFIVLYINAIGRKREIGILKGIGLRRRAIVYSYVIQAVFYALISIMIVVPLVYYVFVPFFQLNPIDFPFGKGTLVVDVPFLIRHFIILVIACFFAGLVPSWLIVQRNTLDSILNR